jgi:sugar transferase (PEP-CTERM/EpsH1 system associated)
MRVLVLTHRLPYAPNRGDRLRAFHILQWLRRRADVDLVSFVHDDEEAGHADEVRAFVPHVTTLRVPKWWNHARAATTLLGGKPLTHSLLDAPGMGSALRRICGDRRPDVVFAYGSGMARFALEPPLNDIPLVLDFVDMDSRKWLDLAAASRPPLSWVYRREAATLGAFEKVSAARASAALVVNEREVAIAQALAPAANVRVIANGVELERLRPTTPPAANPRVVFCGVMNYAPNDEGISWFVRDVWPRVRARRPDATLAIVGADPRAALRTLAGGDTSIHLTGRVGDVREWLWASAVGIAPLRVARGVQNKALEAIAAGLPIVITEAVAGGLPAAAATAALVADDAGGFADHVLALLALTPGERRARAGAADLSQLAWSTTLEPLWPLIETAAVRRWRADSGHPVADLPSPAAN